MRRSVRTRAMPFAAAALMSASLVGSPVCATELATSGDERRVAITIDDLPFTGGPRGLEVAEGATADILGALERHGVRAAGFVTGGHVAVPGEVDARLRLLGKWVEDGHDLENHSYSHRSFNRSSFDAYRDDIVLGQLFPDMAMRARGDSTTFVRHPFNHTGPSVESKRRFATFLDARGLRLAPTTVEHGDYFFNRLYVDAFARADTARMRELGDAYLSYLDTSFARAEKLTLEMFGRPIAHVFLIHTNLINAHYLDRLLSRLAARGYSFVSLEEAMTDPAYATPDEYVGRNGVTWLHRWRPALGLPSVWREDPDPPRWVIDAFRELEG